MDIFHLWTFGSAGVVLFFLLIDDRKESVSAYMK